VQTLIDTFSAFGVVLSARVMMDEEGKPRGFGFVSMETFEGADAGPFRGYHFCSFRLLRSLFLYLRVRSSPALSDRGHERDLLRWQNNSSIICV